jgi:type I restriction enzyme S subunit
MNPVQQLLTENIGLWTCADTAKKTGRGRASGSAGAVYGIKKLRELILELAVRGKLVPQDANDEPASELLKQIQAEKNKLIVEGKIKKDKPLAAITEDEKPFELPQGWEWARLGFIGSTQTGTTPSKSSIENFGFDIPFIKPSDIYSNYVDYDNEGLSIYGAQQSGRVARAGSLLMVCIGTIGKCNLIMRNCSFNQQINSVTPYVFDSTYLLSVCRSVYFHAEAWSRSSSTTIAILNKGNWERICIPVPPITEQHRIVAKVDELMALCDRLEAGQIDAADAHEKLVSHLLAALTASQDSADFSASWQRIAAHFDMLFTTEASIDALKQTLLQLAVMGKLVPQDPSDEPASALLERIQVEKAKLVFEGKIKKEKALAAITDDEKPFSLPQGWEWVRSEYISTAIVDCPHSTPIFVNSGMLCVDTNSIKQGSLIVDKMRYVDMETFLIRNRRLVPMAGDIVFAREGSVGESFVIPKEMVCCLGQRVMLFRLFNNINSEYFRLALTEPGSLGRLLILHKGIGARHVNVADMRAALIPLPPSSEQHRIVAKIDELMALCDRMKGYIADASALQRKLADVIVAQAVA